MKKCSMYNVCSKNDEEMLKETKGRKILLVGIISCIYAVVMCLVSYYASVSENIGEYIKYMMISIIVFIILAVMFRIGLKFISLRLDEYISKKGESLS